VLPWSPKELFYCEYKKAESIFSAKTGAIKKQDRKQQAWRQNSGALVHLGLGGSKNVMRTEERSYTTMRSIYFYTSLSKLFFLR